MKKYVLVLLKIFTCIYVFSWFFVIGFLGYSAYAGTQYIQSFFTFANTTPSAFVQDIQKGIQTQPQMVDGRKNFLVLGVDTLEGRPDETILTDTMMLVSLNLKNGNISSLSIPRDLWVDTYKTKINSFYQYGRTKYPEEPERFTKEVIEELFGVSVHHTIVVELSDLAYIIDTLGGIDVNIEHSFEDRMFPKEGVDVLKVKDPSLLYETVAFTKGIEHMNGKRALQFVRSRHSQDITEGTDEARVKRQQIVISSIMKTMMSPSVFFDTEKMGLLYRWYTEKYGNVLSISELVSTMMYAYPNVKTVSYEPTSLSIRENGKPGVIYHPTRLVFGQWVYMPIDGTWKEVKNEAQNALNK